MQSLHLFEKDTIMFRPPLSRRSSDAPQAQRRGARPILEALEQRLLLYSDLGDKWTYDSRITYSFMPDGTSVGGVSSVLFQTLNAKYATTTWEGQIEDAASLWETASNANLAVVSDAGEAVGSNGDQQDDPRFGDIRIGMVPLGAGILAETFLPPTANGGTDAGDILFNSTINWQINSSYDLMTVAAHEFGHALGLGESTVSTAVMYGTYNGVKQTLTSDDISGIQSIYGTRTFDQFNNAGTHNSALFTAANINSYIISNQIAIPNLDITTGGQAEWFFVNVPATTTGTMKVTVQSSNLSSLAPLLQVYNSSGSLLGQTSAPNTFGATISLSFSVSSGQGYYIKATDAGGAAPAGNYGLLVNFGSSTQSPIAPPNTVVTQQPDGGGGTINNVVVVGGSSKLGGSTGGLGSGQGNFTAIGALSGWAEDMIITASTPTSPGSGNLTATVAFDPIGDTGDSSSTTPFPLVTHGGGIVAIAVNSSGQSPTGSAPLAVVVTGPPIPILQAVDEVLGQLDLVELGSGRA
jgi:Matrixin